MISVVFIRIFFKMQFRVGFITWKAQPLVFCGVTSSLCLSDQSSSWSSYKISDDPCSSHIVAWPKNWQKKQSSDSFNYERRFMVVMMNFDWQFDWFQRISETVEPILGCDSECSWAGNQLKELTLKVRWHYAITGWRKSATRCFLSLSPSSSLSVFLSASWLSLV